MRARTELVRLIARLDVPISLGESEAFVEYIKNAHNPKYTKVSRQTTSRDILKYFTDCKAKLVETQRRRSLKPEMVEMLTCIKDWEAAEARLQQNVEDKELEEAFEELYLDS